MNNLTAGHKNIISDFRKRIFFILLILAKNIHRGKFSYTFTSEDMKLAEPLQILINT